MVIGFLSLGVVLFAGADVGCAAACDAVPCDEVVFADAVLVGDDLEPLCFSVGRSGSSEGAEASDAFWLVSEEDADGVGVGEASGDALFSGR